MSMIIQIQISSIQASIIIYRVKYPFALGHINVGIISITVVLNMIYDLLTIRFIVNDVIL